MLDETLLQNDESLGSAQAASRDERPSLSGYELGRRLGSGSFGEVWTATQASTGQAVAIKFLSDISLTRLHYFKRELERLRDASDHPGVVGLIDANLEHSHPYFVMPLLTRSLSQQNEPIVAELCASWIQQLAAALSHSHDKGMLHCDLKPSNVMMDEAGLLRLVDFGQSCQQGDGVVSWGTLGYMAPEQAALGSEEPGSAPSQRWDVYGLGATFYRLLTGRCPYWSDAELQELSQLPLQDSLRRYRQGIETRRLRPLSTDQDLTDILTACLRPDPDKRTPTMGVILEDLQRRRLGQPLLCRRPWSWSYRAGKWLRRPAVLVALLAALGLVAFAAYSYRQQSALITDLLEQRAASAQSERPEEAGLLWAAALKRSPNDPVLRTRLATPRFAQVEVSDDPRDGFLPIPGRPELVLTGEHPKRIGSRRVAASDTGDQIVPSPDGRQLACIKEREVQVWSYPENKMTDHWPLPESFQGAAWNAPDQLTLLTEGRALRYGTDGSLLLTRQLPAGCVLSPDGNWVRVQEQNQARFLPVAGGPHQTVASDRAEGEEWFSPHSKLVVSERKGQLVFHSLAERKPDWVYGPGTLGCWVDDETVAILQGSQVRIEQAKDTLQILDHRAHVLTVSASPDGAYLLSYTVDYRVHLWDLASGQHLTSKPLVAHTGAFLGFSGDSSRFYAHGGEHPRVWNCDPWRPEWSISGNSEKLLSVPTMNWFLAASLDGYRVFGLDGQLRGKQAWSEFRGGRLNGQGVLAVDLGDSIQRIRGLDGPHPTSETLVRYQPSPEQRQVERVCFSQDGQSLAAALPDKLLVWRAGRAEPLQVPLEHEPLALAFNPAASEVAILTTQGLLRCRLADGQLTSLASMSYPSEPYQVFYFEEQLFAQAGDILWTGGRERKLPVHDRMPLARSRDVLLAALRDSVEVYQLPDIKPLGPPAPFAGGASLLLIDPEARFWLIGSNDGSWIWDRQGRAPLDPSPQLPSAASGLLRRGQLILSGPESIQSFSLASATGSPDSITAQWERATGFRLEDLRILRPLSLNEWQDAK